MKSEKISTAAERLLEVQQLLLEAGLAPNGHFIREIQDLHSNLALFARVMTQKAA